MSKGVKNFFYARLGFGCTFFKGALAAPFLKVLF
jgi:hypothetical protein